MKLGLGQSYDKVEFLPVKLRAYLDLTKPASSVGVAGAYLLASLFYFYYTGEPHLIGDRLQPLLYVTFTLALAHGASQALNMAEDAEMDRNTPHKKDRPIPSGIVSEEEARTIAWILILFAVARGFLTNRTFGVFLTILVFFGVFYNLEPIRAKERVISIPWQAVSRGLLLFPTVWSAWGDPFAPEAWVLGLFMFFYVLGFQNTADIVDMEVDEEYGVKTFAVMYGPSGIVFIAAWSTLLMFGTIVTGARLGLVPLSFGVFLAIIPFCILMIYYLSKYPNKVSEKTGNHPAWLWFYIGMVLSVVLPLAVEYWNYSG